MLPIFYIIISRGKGLCQWVNKAEFSVDKDTAFLLISFNACYRNKIRTIGKTIKGKRIDGRKKRNRRASRAT